VCGLVMELQFTCRKPHILAEIWSRTIIWRKGPVDIENNSLKYIIIYIWNMSCGCYFQGSRMLCIVGKLNTLIMELVTVWEEKECYQTHYE